ncbi:MAG: hypothetical protein J0I20_31330 [Chloroflexi bacterium]|nr:hypothetical protein [Chloroflexota bacterium]OJV94027.1 MAG: hypothetical protein BGO39_06855 [Chloroflexi bacterium 54-19]
MSLTKNDIVGLVAGILPFFLFIGGSTTQTVNGQVVNQSSLNLVALIGGAIAIIMAFIGFRTMSEREGNRSLYLGLFVVLALLGAYQVARGIGLVA